MSGENTPKSEIGKISYQNWKSEPKNSPKAFGELISCTHQYLILICTYYFFKERSMNSEFFCIFVCDESYIEVASSHADYNFFFQFYSHHYIYD